MIDILDMHTHTVASGHAYNTIYEMVHSAADKGLQLLGIADHGPAMPGSAQAIYFSNFKMLPRKIGGIRVMFGCELNILDYEGHVDLPEHILVRQDYAVASIHGLCYESGTAAQNTAAYINVMKNPLIHIIGHPDDARFPVDYDTLVAAAKEHHTLLEVNSNSMGPTSVRPGARDQYLIMLEYCKKYRQSVIIDSDAHCEVDVGNHFRAIDLLEEVGFPPELVVNRSLEALADYIPKLKHLLATPD